MMLPRRVCVSFGGAVVCAELFIPVLILTHASRDAIAGGSGLLHNLGRRLSCGLLLSAAWRHA